MSKEKINKEEKHTSPLLSLVFKIREMRNSEMDFRMGKVLTIVDALIEEGKQNKAAKDVIRSAFYERAYFWDDLEKHLAKLKEDHCPKIEDGYAIKVNQKSEDRPNHI